MRIIKMSATFGKLEGAELTLEPGLNILQGDNEWGKSTWCAFLLAMLYGLDTRAKTTKTALADKERYAPWSGSPMSGRLDVNWRGRNITVERTTKGRIPLGEFRAYETDTGLEVPELTAANCGEVLLGAEQSVYRRAGFLRLQDLPVTQDEALRRRLNALVTTADDSGDAQLLEKGLRELKNRCRYHRTGLLPQAEEEREALAAKLEERGRLTERIAALEQRLEEARNQQRLLENHTAALDYAAAQADAQRVARAREEALAAEEDYRQLQRGSAALPEQSLSREKLYQVQQLARDALLLQQKQQTLPREPQPPLPVLPFGNMTREQAGQMLREDAARYDALNRRRPLAVLGAVLLAVLAAALAWAGKTAFAAAAAAAALVWAVGALLTGSARKRGLRALQQKYGAPTPGDWEAALGEHLSRQEDHQKRLLEYRSATAALEEQRCALETRRQSLCGGQDPEKVAAAWEQTLERRTRLEQAREHALRARTHLQTLEAMARPARKPEQPDELTLTPEQTLRELSHTAQEQQRLLERLGQYRGRRDALGSREELEGALEALDRRIVRLEQTYAAAELGLKTLDQARQELQRRFAPVITQRAGALLAQLTRGRYTRLRLDRELTLHTQAEGEPVLRQALWRSDGTADQLYLALRLAVAEELTPGAPLVLDDALVRFDDDRLKAALEVLEGLAEKKQILLFTCQNREKAIIQGR